MSNEQLDPRLLETKPKVLKNLEITIITYNNNVVDITPNVTEVSI